MNIFPNWSIKKNILLLGGLIMLLLVSFSFNNGLLIKPKEIKADISSSQVTVTNPISIVSSLSECEKQTGGKCIYWLNSCPDDYFESDLKCDTRSEKCCLSCAKQGEKVNRNPLLGEPTDRKCCVGLTEVKVSKSYSVCVNCGDGLCESPEDKENCPQDCEEPIQVCEDQTPVGECSQTQPLYCNQNLKLIDKCQECGCPEGEQCSLDGTCVKEVQPPQAPGEKMGETKTERIGNTWQITLQPEAWHMVSNPSQETITTTQIMEDCDIDPWLWSYNPNTGGYEMLEDPVNLESGTGYWAYNRGEECTFTVQDTPYNLFIELKADQWYMIGGPGQKEKISDIPTTCETLYLYEWLEEDQGYKLLTQNDPLKPGKGYWIRSSSDCTFGTQARTIAIFVDENTYYALLKSEILRYANDIEADLEVSTQIITGSWDYKFAYLDVKQSIDDLYNQQNLIAVIFIGEIPLGEPGTVSDSWYRDISGEDGLPEIWSGRVKFPVPLDDESVDGVQIMKDFFQRNHLKRESLPHANEGRFLFFDTLQFGENYYCNYTEIMEGICGDSDEITNPIDIHGLYDKSKCSTLCTGESSNAENAANQYLELLKDDSYEFVFFRSHGSPSRGRAGEDYINKQIFSEEFFIDYEDIIAAEPKAEFYFLLSCNNGEWTSNNYIAGWYLFAGGGLAVRAVGTHDNIGQGPPSNFFGALSVGCTFGEAATMATYADVIGDPTLRLRPRPSISELKIKDIVFCPNDLIDKEVNIVGEITSISSSPYPYNPFAIGYEISDDSNASIIVHTTDFNHDWINKTVEVKGTVQRSRINVSKELIYIEPTSIELLPGPEGTEPSGEKKKEEPEKPISKMTIPELKNEIRRLTTLIKHLQSQLKEKVKVPSPVKEKEGKTQWRRNLKIGMRGNDVKTLQETLIKEKVWPRPDIEATGYFGPITKQAVTEFQEKHNQEILEPLGLEKGTGFVGLSTRDYLKKKTKK